MVCKLHDVLMHLIPPSSRHLEPANARWLQTIADAFHAAGGHHDRSSRNWFAASKKASLVLEPYSISSQNMGRGSNRDGFCRDSDD
jgi:hypothetical protein